MPSARGLRPTRPDALTSEHEVEHGCDDCDDEDVFEQVESNILRCTTRWGLY